VPQRQEAARDDWSASVQMCHNVKKQLGMTGAQASRLLNLTWRARRGSRQGRSYSSQKDSRNEIALPLTEANSSAISESYEPPK